MNQSEKEVEEWDGTSASGNIIQAATFKAPQKVSGLKLDADFWDLKCLECKTFNLRFLSVQLLQANKLSAAVTCNKCASNHRVFLIRKWKYSFSVSVERDYKDYSKADDFEQIHIHQGKRYKRKKFSPKELKTIYAKTKGRCDLCKGKLIFEEYGKSYGWQVDHRFPLDRGGTHDFENIWPACSDCNRNKKNSTKEEYLRGESYNILDDI
jgi:5-methylcytosine-specific restriction endonuclease McrA